MMNRSILTVVQSRAAADGAFRTAIEQAWKQGGLAAAAGVARAHGIAVPACAADSELSDLELEQVAGGKGPVWVGVGSPGMFLYPGMGYY